MLQSDFHTRIFQYIIGDICFIVVCMCWIICATGTIILPEVGFDTMSNYDNVTITLPKARYWKDVGKTT